MSTLDDYEANGRTDPRLVLGNWFDALSALERDRGADG